MFGNPTRKAARTFRKTGLPYEDGLSAGELSAVEDYLGYRLPPDLSTFLGTAHPVGEGFPDWRDLGSELLARKMEWPLHGILFDIEHDDFWPVRWGPSPVTLQDRLDAAREHFRTLPPLVPIYSHRYIPAEPHRIGNPVFSVYQTDVIYYGCDLLDYIKSEFLGSRRSDFSGVQQIPFWGELSEGRDV